MGLAWLLAETDQRVRRLRYRTPEGRTTTVQPALTVREVCHVLRKSRRQVYRYLRQGRLRPCLKVLDQWLFAQGEVDRCASRGVPSILKPFFWDVGLSSLSVEHHRDFILARLLEFGDRAAMRWVVGQYRRAELVDFLTHRGADVLSSRSYAFWAGHWGLARPGPSSHSWRRQGRRWGGLA